MINLLNLLLNLWCLNLPESQNIHNAHLSGTYFNCIMFMVASSVVTTIMILNYHHRLADTHEMPNWVTVTIIIIIIITIIIIMTIARCVSFSFSGSLGFFGWVGLERKSPEKLSWCRWWWSLWWWCWWWWNCHEKEVSTRALEGFKTFFLQKLFCESSKFLIFARAFSTVRWKRFVSGERLMQLVQCSLHLHHICTGSS